MHIKGRNIKFSSAEIRGFLKEIEDGRPVMEVCAEYGVADYTLQIHRKKLNMPAVAVKNRAKRRKQQTEDLVRAAIDSLRTTNQKITLTAIRAETTVVSKGARTIGEAAFTNNKDLRRLVADLGGPPIRVEDPNGLRRATIERDGWSARDKDSYLLNMEATREPAFAAMKASITMSKRLLTVSQLCAQCGFKSGGKTDIRFRVHCRDFVINELPTLEQAGDVSVSVMLSVMQTMPDYFDRNVTSYRVAWLCSYLLDHTDRPFTKEHLDQIANDSVGEDFKSIGWPKIVRDIRRKEIEKGFKEIEQCSGSNIVEGEINATRIIRRLDRLMVARTPTPRDVWPESVIRSVCDYMFDRMHVVPTYLKLASYLSFMPASNSVGGGYSEILTRWRSDRDLPDAVRGGMDSRLPRSWEQLAAALPEPVKSAPNTMLDPRASAGRFLVLDDETAIKIGRAADPHIRAVVALGALAGCRRDQSLPGFSRGLSEVIAVAKLNGPTDARLEDALKALALGELHVLYASDDVGNADDEPGDEEFGSIDTVEDDDDNASAEEQGDEPDSGWTVNRLKDFFMTYRAITFAHQKFLKELDPPLREAFDSFILPQLKDQVFWKTSRITKVVAEAQKKRRKARTDALFPRFGEIRTTCEFKVNIANRIRIAFNDAVEKARKGELSIPYRFILAEPDSELGPAADHEFVLWSRLEIGKSYRSSAKATNPSGMNRDRKAADYFVEYAGAKALNKAVTAKELWFADIIRYNACHKETIRNSDSDAFLKSHGIPPGQYTKLSATLAGGRGLSSALIDLIKEVRRRGDAFNPVYFHPDGLYTICLAGRAATRVICVTTCRVNEAQQIFAGEECLVRLELPNLNAPAYAFMAIPKLRTEQEPFFLDDRCLRFIREQAEWLANESEGNNIPMVYGARNLAKHKRAVLRPFIFQFPSDKPVAMDANTIGSIVRFMLHDIIVRTIDGVPFQPGLHDLRHVTATAYRDSGVPIPVLAKMMKQGDYSVTDYYSKPTHLQVVTAVRGLSIAQIGIGKAAGTRMPDELDAMSKEADGRVGALSNVFGGNCGVVIDCAARFACIGCGGLIPDHHREEEVRRGRERRQQDLDYWVTTRNFAEVRKAEQDLRDFDRVLEEMRLQKEAEADGKRAPKVREHVVQWHKKADDKDKK